MACLGPATWKPEWARYLEGLTAYIWQEPDKGGETLVSGVGATLPDVRVITAPLGRKDISECHCNGENVPALMRELMAAARPYRQIEAEQTSKEAAAARASGQALLDCDDILGEFSEYCSGRGMVGETNNAKLLYLVVTSRLQSKPVSVVVKGPVRWRQELRGGNRARGFPGGSLLRPFEHV